MAVHPPNPAPGEDAQSALGPDREAVERHLARVLESPPFARAPRMQRFLSFLVEEALAGRAAQLKEYTVAVAVFGKPPEFEPGTSAIVRVEAGRLRKLLMEYAVEHGRADAVVLEIPKGSYVPVLRARLRETELAPAPARRPEEGLGDAQARPPAGSQMPAWSVPAERRQVTVLSCALGDEGGAARGPPTQELLTSFDLFHATSTAVACRHGGTVEGSASDRVIVYFGWPHALEDAAGRALTAALDILAEVQAALMTSSFGIRIGVATSEVVVREPPCDDGQARPAVIGDAPALATRILQRAPLNGILVAEATRRLTGTAFELIPAGEIESPAQAPDLIWRLLKPRPVLTRYRASHSGAQQQLIGRREEFALLICRWRLALEAEGQGVLIAGPAGIGKSKLVESVLEQIALEGAVLRLQCSPHHTNSTLYPFVELIKSQVAAEEAESGPLALRLEDFRRRFDLNHPQDAALLDALLSLVDDEALRAISASQRKDLTLGLLRRMLAAQVAQAPTVVLIEDVHWADPTTLELIQEVLHMAAASRLLVLLTGRGELEAGCLRQTNLTSIRLTRLPKREANELIDRMASDVRLSAAARTLILEKAEGIPLFIEELTKLVLGADEKRTGKSPIPESLSGLLASQLDRLGGTRSIAQLAAIVGRDFTADMLALAASCPVKDIETALDQLAAAGILVRVGREDSNVFSFRHALLRDAAYGSILEQTRRELHLRVGKLMIERFPQILAEHPELIARHLSEAGCPGDAIPFWIDAGRKAAGRYALAEAIADFELALGALAMLPASPSHRQQELEVLIQLGLAIRNARGYGDRGLLEIYERARALAAEATDLPNLASAVYGLWTHAAGKGEWRTALVLAREFEDLSRRARDSQLELEAHRLLGASAAFAGDLATARQHFERVLARYDIGRHGPALGFDPGAVSAAYLAWTVWHLGDAGDAARYAAQAIAIAEAKGHPPTLAVVLSWLIFYHVCTGNTEAILECNRRLQTVCSERDCRYWQPFGNACAEWAEFGLDGDPQHLERMLALTGEFRERYFTSCLLLLGAEMCLRLQQTQRGLQTVASARELIEKHDEQLWQAELHRLHAELMLQGTPERARDAGKLLQCAIETARRQNARSLEGRAVSSLEHLKLQSTRARGRQRGVRSPEGH